MTIISFCSQQFSSFARLDEILWTSHYCDEYESVSFLWWDFACCSEYWDELLRKYADNVFCVVSRNVRCDLRNAIQICSLLKWSVTIRSRDHAWSSHRHFDEWRMSILDYRVTYICSRFVKRRLWWDVIKLDETFHQTLCERLIKLDESDSSNLMSENVISSNLTKATHQTWWRHFIKFLKRKTIFLFFDEQSSATTFDMKNLVLQRIIILREDKEVCVRLLW
jgi:hypothetical protein